METIISYPEKKEHIEALKAFLTALRIKFEDVPNYNLKAKIKEARQEKLDGELKQLNPKNIWTSIS